MRHVLICLCLVLFVSDAVFLVLLFVRRHLSLSLFRLAGQAVSVSRQFKRPYIISVVVVVVAVGVLFISKARQVE